MRIAFLADTFPALSETFIYREFIELTGKGFDIMPYSIRKPRYSAIHAEAFALYEQTYYLTPVSITKVLNIHACAFVNHPYKYLTTLFKMITGTHTKFRDRMRSIKHFVAGVVFADEMIKDNISHIHAHFASQVASISRVISLLTDIPYSFTAHAHDIWQDKLLLPEKLNEAKFIVCCSSFGRTWLLKEYGDNFSNKVHLVYHGLDIRKFTPPINEEKRKKNCVLSVGRLTEQKGFPDLINACAILRDRNFIVECLIIGEGEMRNKLEKMIHSLKLYGIVKLKGAILQEDIIKYYQSAWIFCLPCIDTQDGNRDGIPNVLMEAMAMGLPVITTANSGQGELIEHEKHGLLVNSNSPADLANAIEKLCKDNILRKKIGDSARKRMEEDFDDRNTIKPLLSLYDRFVLKN